MLRKEDKLKENFLEINKRIEEEITKNQRKSKFVFNNPSYNDISKIPGASVWVGWGPGYATSSSEYGYLWWCSYSVTQGAVDKCYCRDTSKDVNCPSGLYCSGTTSGTCTKSVCGNGKCEERETASSCGAPNLPAGCDSPASFSWTGTPTKTANKCTRATFYRGNCEVDCNPEWWTPGMPEASQPCNLYYLT